MRDDPTHWMDLALQEATKGRGWVEPNPMVGAVLVRDDSVVGTGHHGRFGGPHAEVEALRDAGASARGATLYVTLEPCCHHGKTPPCTDAVVDAGITRVVAAIRDPFPRVAGGGLAQLRDAGIQVDLGLRGEAAADLNRAYLKRVLVGRPYVIAKWAMTLDGKAAVAGGDSQWISSPGSRARVHELRGRMDAIVVGIGTALTDDPQLTVRPPGPRTPVRIVLDSHGRLPVGCRLARTAREVPLLVAVTEAAPSERSDALRNLGCEILHCPGTSRIEIGPLLEGLASRGMTNILVEGGGRTVGSFLDAGEVDEVDAYIAPIVEGGDHPRTPARGLGVTRMSAAQRLERVCIESIGDDAHLRGLLRQEWNSRLSELAHPVMTTA